MKTMDCHENDCDYKSGSLPSCVPLALAYVPMQDGSAPQYNAPEALARGTLFPGLDLPLKNVVNEIGAPNTPLGELMALGFVVHELGLYLDTHADDSDAFDMFRRYAALYKDGEARYVKEYGPLTQMQSNGSAYSWLNSPWPWEYDRGGAK